MDNSDTKTKAAIKTKFRKLKITMIKDSDKELAKTLIVSLATNFQEKMISIKLQRPCCLVIDLKERLWSTKRIGVRSQIVSKNGVVLRDRTNLMDHAKFFKSMLRCKTKDGRPRFHVTAKIRLFVEVKSKKKASHH